MRVVVAAAAGATATGLVALWLPPRVVLAAISAMVVVGLVGGGAVAEAVVRRGRSSTPREAAGGPRKPALRGRTATSAPAERPRRQRPSVVPSIADSGPAARAEEALALVSTVPQATPSVVLLLSGFEPSNVFAGVRTAVLAAAHLASSLDRPLRVRVLSAVEDAVAATAAVRGVIREDRAASVVAETLVLEDTTAAEGRHHAHDVWIATYWTTAHAAAASVERGTLRREQVVYLVQDFEAGFHPWGDTYGQVLATYEAGFHLLVNSEPLAEYLQHETGRAVAADSIFAPEVDRRRLLEAAGRWRPSPDGRTRLLFYARPSKPRNLFGTGVLALRRWADGLAEGHRAVVRLAGEDLRGHVPELGPKVEVEALGKLSMADYYDVVADTDVGLALMLSPHPGHLSLELPMAGVPTVTNDFLGFRAAWLDGLTVAPAGPGSLADALATAVAGGRVEPGGVPALGSSLDAAVADLARLLRQS